MTKNKTKKPKWKKRAEQNAERDWLPEIRNMAKRGWPVPASWVLILLKAHDTAVLQRDALEKQLTDAPNRIQELEDENEKKCE